MQVAILGGGLAGLGTGFFLKQKAIDFTLFEAQEDIGGLERTIIRDGFTFDVGGGHILYSKDQEVLNLILDLVGRENFKLNHRNTKIYYKGHYIKYPFENGLGDLPEQDKFRCLSSYIEAHYARQNGKRAPVNFRDWILWRFGQGIAEAFMFPYNEKLWNVDLATMETGWVKGRVPDAPLEDVLKAALGIATEGYVHQSKFYYPLKGGYQTISNAFASPIRARIRVNTPVHQVEAFGSGWIVNGDYFDAVVSSLPLNVLTDVLIGVPPRVREAAQNLRYCSLATVLIGLEGSASNTYSWVYLPHPDNGPCNRVTYFSNYSPHNAPPGNSSILAEVTFPFDQEPKINQQFANEVVASLHKIGILDKSKVYHTSWWFHRYAYLVYMLDYKANLSTIFDYLELVGIKTIGRFGRFRYQNSDHLLRDVIEFVKQEF